MTAACPGCGAPVTFRWAQAVQATCPYCKGVLVRTDLDLALVGRQADFPRTGSPIQVGTTGRWRGTRFDVVGRLTYQWERGRWNEWHCRLADGRSAWLSDAQLEYAMTEVAPEDTPVPALSRLGVGDVCGWHDQRYTVATITEAEYVGTEGELPFTSTSRARCRFVDFRHDAGRFATLDGSEDPPVLYLGEYVDFADLALEGLRAFEGWPAP
ncbi:MAG: DUF4178 domain-containing protein [Gemmatimonadetes bacterium]|nr:DUF4178 domain-containing protein [Gemmatimonadota bacterium]